MPVVDLALNCGIHDHLINGGPRAFFFSLEL